MSRRDRGYIIAVVVLLIVITVKSLAFDPVTLTDPSEVKFGTWVESELISEYDNVLFNSGLVKHRLVSVKQKEEEGDQLYVGKVRRYLFGVIPFSEMYIKEKTLLFE